MSPVDAANNGTRWHLPAVTGRVGALLMVTACGRRGPIRPRDDLGALPVTLPLGLFDEAPLVCDECRVAWDQAEELGELVTMWTSNTKREWRAHGAPLGERQWLMGGRCEKCQTPAATPAGQPLIVVERRKPVVSRVP